MADQRLIEMLLTELNAIRVEQVALRAAFAQIAPPRPLSREDRRVAVLLLPELARTFGSAQPFATAECLESPAVRAIVGRTHNRFRLGRFFARVAGAAEAINGHLLRHEGVSRGVGTWSVFALRTLGTFRDLDSA